MEPDNHLLKKEKSSEPNLHFSGFMLIFGRVPQNTASIFDTVCLWMVGNLYIDFIHQYPLEMSGMSQWLFLVPLKGGIGSIFHPPEGKDYKWYISGIYCQLGDYMLPTTV